MLNTNFTKLLTSIFTQDNITFAIALLGALGTIWNLVKSRRKIDLSVLEYSINKNSVILYVSFINYSIRSILIKSIFLKIDDHYFPCILVPNYVRENTYKRSDGTTRDFIYTIQFPIVLIGESGTSGYVHFVLPQKFSLSNPTNLTFQIVTNTGRAFEKTLTLCHHEPSY